MSTVNLGRIGFVNQGDWSNTTAYKVNDVVKSGNSIFFCLQANTGQSLTNTTYWQKAINGDDYLTNGGNNGELILGTNDASDVKLQTDAVTRATIKSTTGNMLVGTTVDNGLDALQVNGSMSVSSYPNNYGELVPKTKHEAGYLIYDFFDVKHYSSGGYRSGFVFQLAFNGITPGGSSTISQIGLHYVGVRYTGYGDMVLYTNAVIESTAFDFVWVETATDIEQTGGTVDSSGAHHVRLKVPSNTDTTRESLYRQNLVHPRPDYQP